MVRKTEIYLDNAATTHPWPEVVNAVTAAMSGPYGNASSRHRQGLAASREIVRVTEIILDVVGGGPWRVIFTSGGTEANSLAILGSVPKGRRRDIVSTSVEHAAVDEACRAATRKDGSYIEVNAGREGVVSPDGISTEVTETTGLVSTVYAAGEMGTLQPVGAAAKAVKSRFRRCRFHADAVQALGRQKRLHLPPEIDMVTISAHKIHGPQGIGALLVRPDLGLRPILFGGDQQQGARPGTLNLAGIVGFGAALEKLAALRETAVPKMAALSQLLIDGVVAEAARTRPLGNPDARTPGVAIIAFADVESEVLLHTLEERGVLASASSACHATRKTPPKCLIDAGLTPGEGAVRFSLSFDTTEDEINAAIAAIADSVRAVRSGRAGLS
jgi:cysteine desulfurase